jgi:hypothetical protein
MTAKMLAKAEDEPTIGILPGAEPQVIEVTFTPTEAVEWAILLSK